MSFLFLFLKSVQGCDFRAREPLFLSTKYAVLNADLFDGEGDNNSLCDAGVVAVFHDITGAQEQELDSLGTNV